MSEKEDASPCCNLWGKWGEWWMEDAYLPGRRFCPWCGAPVCRSCGAIAPVQAEVTDTGEPACFPCLSMLYVVRNPNFLRRGR